MLSTVVAVLAAAPIAAAQAPRDGFGFGIGDPDPNVGPSLNSNFDELRPKTLRVFANFGHLSGQDTSVPAATEKERARQRIAAAVRAGVQELLFTWTVPPLPTTPSTWYAVAKPYMDEMGKFAVDSGIKKVWWSAANEPNHQSAGWMNTHPHSGGTKPSAGWGTDVLAGYMNQLSWYRAIYRPNDGLVSPEFVDHYQGSALDYSHESENGIGVSVTAHYMKHYVAAGGWYGEMAGWHPYEGVDRQSMLSTYDFVDRLHKTGYPNFPVWVTEVGVHRADDFRSYDEGQQNTRVAFIVNSLANHASVKRLSYYQMRDTQPVTPDPNDRRWDTALTRSDGTRRPAWYTWCDAARNNDAGCYDDSPGAASWGTRHLHVFFRGSGDDAGVRGRFWDSLAYPGGGWSNVGTLDGVTSSGPAVVAPADRRLEVYARGSDNALWHRRFDGANWSSDWTSLGGTTYASPAASARRGKAIVDLFIRGTDNAVWHRFRDGETWSNWGSLGAPPGGATSAPATVSTATGRIDLFVRGGDYGIWQRTFRGGWGAWTSLGGVATSAPAVTTRGISRIDLFVRGIGGTTFHRFTDGAGWSNWGSLGGVSTSAPAAVASSSNRLDVWVRGTDNAIYHKFWAGGPWSDWSSSWHAGP